MITHNITLRVKDQNAVDTGIAVSQGDYGHVQFVMYVKDDDKYITDAEKAEVVFNTPNGYIVTGDAVIKNGTYTYVFAGNELQAPGKISATLTLMFSDGRASACNFVFECRYNALYDRGINAGNYITQIENLTQRAEEALSAADGAAALAEMAKIAAVAAQNAAEIAAANAEAVSGVGIATINKAGLVKPDGATTDVDADGALSVILTDTKGLVGNANAEVTLQAFVDVIADKVANQMLTKAGLVNNGLATNAGVAALDAAYGKTLLDLYTKLNSERQLKTYISYGQIGLTVGIETIASICNALPNVSMLIEEIGSKNNGSIYPKVDSSGTCYGTLRVTKRTNLRIVFEFWYQSTNEYWIGTADTSGTWSGWGKVSVS